MANSLHVLAAAEEIEIGFVRPDGTRGSTPIWDVEVEDRIYVRSADLLSKVTSAYQVKYHGSSLLRRIMWVGFGRGQAQEQRGAGGGRRWWLRSGDPRPFFRR